MRKRHMMRRVGATLLLVFMIVIVSSCMTVIVRRPGAADQERSRDLPSRLDYNIFQTLLWSTPPLGSLIVDLSMDGSGTFEFAAGVYQVTLEDDGTLSVREPSNRVTRVDPRRSQADRYYDVAELQTTVEFEQRWVPRQVLATETVPVHKTRVVTVHGTDAQGMPTTTTRHETYVDLEIRTVFRTEWGWESQPVTRVVIPDYDYYEVPLDSGQVLWVYRLEEDGRTVLAVQNPNYIRATETEADVWGAEEVEIVIIDADSDGFYLGPQDRVMFNSWNPYDQASRYTPLRGMVENLWVDLDFVQRTMFVTLKTNDDHSVLAISDANDRFVGVEDIGALIVHNESEYDAEILANNAPIRRARRGRTSEYEIQHGLYTIQFAPNRPVSDDPSTDGALYAFSRSVTVDNNTPSVEIVYPARARGGVIVLTNIFQESWAIQVRASDGQPLEQGLFVDVTEVPVPAGTIEFTIIADGAPISWSLDIDPGERREIDFEAEIADRFGS